MAAAAAAVRAWPLKGAPEVAAALGRAPALRLCHHPNVNTLLDCIRGRHFTIVTVTENVMPLRSRLGRLAQSPDESFIGRLVFDLFLGLSFLHRKQYAHRMISMDTIQVDNEGRARLDDAFVGELCSGGAGAAFVLGHPFYIAPELLLPQPSMTAAAAGDVWAVGVLLTELLSSSPSSSSSSSSSSPSMSFTSRPSPPQQLPPHTVALRRLASSSSLADLSLLRAGVSEQLVDLVRLCLSPVAADRPTVHELLHHPFFTFISFPLPPPRWQRRPPLKCLSLLDSSPKTARQSPDVTTTTTSDIPEAYALWRAAGADPERELIAAQRSTPPILRLPSLLLVSAAPLHRTSMLRDDVRPLLLSLADLRRRPSLVNLPTPPLAGASGTPVVPPLQRTSSNTSNSSLASSTSSLNNAPTTSAPISPRSLGSQTAARVKQLKELTSALPASLPRLAIELRGEVPPAVRADVWAALLSISSADAVATYQAIDKDSEGPSDRQIEVDIPRCHQYNELLASPEGQRKLKRVLKSWVKRHIGELVYWQGLDSLLAPLLTIFFPNESLAYVGLERLVNKYCREFFRPDNSTPMQEHLLRFRQLLAYHEPSLATHLLAIGFSPDLYAIPWFLTLFSHLLPLEKLYVLWDSLLAGSASLPFFVALAVLHEMCSTLLPLDFNASILFFSHLPELDIREVIRQAVQYEERTPPSIVVPFSPPPPLSVPLPFDERLNEWAPRVAPSEALRLRHVVLIDLRKPKEYESEHVVGAVPLNHKNPSLSQFETYRGRPLLLIADTRGRQAADLAKRLIEANYSEVALVHGGHEALKQVGSVRLEGSSV